MNDQQNTNEAACGGSALTEGLGPAERRKMELCKTCKYWEKPGDYGEVPGTGKCNAVVQFWSATEWGDDDYKRILKTEYAGKLAFVQDGSDYYAELKTLPDFGCVQHEAL